MRRLTPATAGSLGIDIETTEDVTLLSDSVVKIPSNVTGPVSDVTSNIGGLLLGRSSSSVRGLIVSPGVIDADYTGNIQIMAYTLRPPMFVPRGSRIAQIIPLQPALGQHRVTTTPRGNKGFGSTGMSVFFTTKMNEQPTMQVTLIQGKCKRTIYAMLDTGADVTIIDRNIWPESWPVQSPHSSISGVGGCSTPLEASLPVTIQFNDGKAVTLRPFVLPLPGTLQGLIGRDVLSQIGTVLTTDNF